MSSSMNLKCQECGYELMGLAQAGQCPECGNIYDVGTGRGLRSRVSDRHNRGDKVVFYIKFGGLIAAAFVVMGIGGLISLFATDPMAPIATAGVFAFMLLFGALAVWVLDR